jgi:uncharacterized protein
MRKAHLPMATSDAVWFAVKVQPNASKTCAGGREGEFLKIRLAAPPVDGKANEALIEFVARRLSIAKSYVHIRSGVSSRRKVIQVEGCSKEKFLNFLAEFGS